MPVSAEYGMKMAWKNGGLWATCNRCRKRTFLKSLEAGLKYLTDRQPIRCKHKGCGGTLMVDEKQK